MLPIYRATHSAEKMFASEANCSTILKAYEHISDWHRESTARESELTPYRGYYNRFKDGEIVSYTDAIEGTDNTIHSFKIEEIIVR
jgi:hypothetical protein